MLLKEVKIDERGRVGRGRRRGGRRGRVGRGRMVKTN